MNRRWVALVFLLATGVTARSGLAQLAPEIGYVHPAGAAAGTTVDVKIGGYDWTPDMQIFVHDPRVKLELIGPLGPVLVPDPPYWFGAKGRGYAWPLPREFPARLTIPADVPPGLVKFQVANANGASPPKFLHVGGTADAVDQDNRTAPQVLPTIPITVSGQIRLIEEVDRYEFTAPRSGPLTIELFARRFGSMLHGLLKVHDEQGRLVLDRADTEGRDFAETFIAEAGKKYTVSLHDLDFAGDRSYVYRLVITPRPRVLAAYPAAGKRGETREVEFLGLGIATGANKIESLKANVPFPASPAESFEYVLETPQGRALPVALRLSDHPELLKTFDAAPFELPQVPASATGSFSARFGADRYVLAMKSGERWKLTAQADAIGSPLDLDLTVLGPDGKEIARSDDMPGTTDPQVNVNAAAECKYTALVTDRSGKSGTREANYRLTVEPQAENFSITPPTHLAVPLGGTAKLPLKAQREGGFKGPIQVTLTGLPAGVTAPADLKFAENANDLTVDLTAAANAAVSAGLVRVVANAPVQGQAVTQTSAPLLVATILKPRIKITPEGLDDVRKVHRGSTFLAPLLIDRLEGYQGEVTLEMTAKQQRHRQGLSSGEFTVPPDARRVEYPIFVPEWMETTKTSRMILNGVVRVADPQGNVRTLLQRQELRIGILPEGALMKLACADAELTAAPGGTVRVPLTLSRAAGFQQEARIELVAPGAAAASITAEPCTLPATQTEAELLLKLAGDSALVGEHSITLRATSLKDGQWPVVSQVTLALTVSPGSQAAAK